VSPADVVASDLKGIHPANGIQAKTPYYGPIPIKIGGAKLEMI
jgi:hypothetical protein